MFVSLLLGCNEADPDGCYPNPAGGAGGAGSMPVGAAVGAAASGDYGTAPRAGGDGSGGFGDAPPKNPQDATNPSNPCEVGGAPGFPANRYVNCLALGLDASACSEACFDVGASCAPLAVHPYKTEPGPGKLIYCKNGYPTTTCTWRFPNTDACSMIVTFGHGITWFCKYAGGN